MGFRRLSAMVAAGFCGGLVLVSCGGGTGRVARVHSPCPRAVGSALGAGTQTARRSHALDLVTCVYRASGPRGAILSVTVDTAPQALRRFGRWVVEHAQANLGAPRTHLPQLLQRIGDGAAWVPATRELRATANGRLVIVVVRRPAPGLSARATAVAPTRAALGR
jgi:hypothetical protein